MADRRDRLETAALIAAGGFGGANLRYVLALVLPGPAGTLVANVLGSFALGALTHPDVPGRLLSRRGRLLLATGLLASFTTYSTFAVATARSGLPTAAGNVAATYVLGFAAVVAGRSLVGRVTDG
jgi:CrcB protein